MNNTVFIAGGSVAGAVVGGALGSFAGPIGTVVGGAIGSAVGGFIGEKVAKLTSGFAEQVAVKLKDPIHAVVDKGKKHLNWQVKVLKQSMTPLIKQIR